MRLNPDGYLIVHFRDDSEDIMIPFKDMSQHTWRVAPLGSLDMLQIDFGAYYCVYPMMLIQHIEVHRNSDEYQDQEKAVMLEASQQRLLEMGVTEDEIVDYMALCDAWIDDRTIENWNAIDAEATRLAMVLAERQLADGGLRSDGVS